MVERADLEAFLGAASVDAEVFELRPDYRAILLAVDGLVPGISDADSDVLLARAEAAAVAALQANPVEDVPHVSA